MDEVRKAKTVFKKLNPFSSKSRFKGEGHTLGSSSDSSTPRNPRQDQQQQQQQQELRKQQQERWEQERQAKPSKKGHKIGTFPSDRQQEQSTRVLDSPGPDRSSKPGTPSLASSNSAEGPRSTGTAPPKTTLPYSSPAPPFPEDEVRADREEVETQVATFLSNGASKEALDVLLRLLKNIVREPGNDKFSKIRMGNPKIQETIGSAAGSIELLEFLGFQHRVDEQGEAWYVMDVVSSDRLAVLKVAASLLGDQLAQQSGVSSSAGDSSSQSTTSSAAAPVSVAPPDRELRVFFCSPETATVRVQLPDDFYQLSLQEVKAQAALHRKKVEESQLLVTKTYREKQALARRSKFKFGIVRVQFPDGIVLQGIFLPREPTSAIYTFVRFVLKKQIQFELIDPVNTKCKVISWDLDSSKCPSLEQAELLPTAVLKFRTESSDFCGLHDELLAKMEPLTTSPF